MDSLREFFIINRPIVLFVYGLTFFVMGLAVFLQSRRHSRLRLSRDLYWLAAFGILHGIHEWGVMFIPIQSEYLPPVFIHLLLTLQVVVLALSFLCLLMFGAVTLERRHSRLKKVVIFLSLLWGLGFWVSFYLLPSVDDWHLLSNISARYLLGATGGLLAAYGLRYQAQTDIEPLNTPHIYQTLRIAGSALFAYAVVGGLIVPEADFFPASVINRQLIIQLTGVPVEVIRSLTGLILAVAIIRALEIFEIELDHRIEEMEVERIQAAERDRIGQDIHDGVIQDVYSASLILEATEALLEPESEAARRVHQAKNVLNAVNLDLRSYMVSLRAEAPPDPLVPSLKQLIANPRFQGLLDIDLTYAFEPDLKPTQVHHLLSIVQESLSNTLKHARARKAKIAIARNDGIMTVSIVDDGRGFSPTARSAGYGLRSMRDRARLLGGQLEVESSMGKGTSVIFTLPEDKR
jgi:signal transduction histidine kinase